MNYRRFGTAGVSLPEVGLGTWKYRGGVGPLRRGIELGATFIDTAESYGSEEVVGKAIRGLRDRVFLATKISPPHFRRADVIRSAEASLRRLGTDYIDLYQLHWPNLIVPLEETLGAMEQLVDQGKIRFIGVSNFVTRELRRVQAVLTRHRLFSNQVRYSLIDRSIEGRLLGYCRRNGIAVIAFTPLGHGLDRIAAMDPSGALGEVATEAGRTQAQTALSWCLAQEGVVTIPKASTIEHVDDVCGTSGWSLTPDQVMRLSSRIRYRRRGTAEMAIRRAGRYVYQRLGWEPA